MSKALSVLIFTFCRRLFTLFYSSSRRSFHVLHNIMQCALHLISFLFDSLILLLYL